MDDLIAALQIFRKYTNSRWPTHCEHDVMMVGVNPEDVTAEDKQKLKELGFSESDEYEVFVSFRFGSA